MKMKKAASMLRTIGDFILVFAVVGFAIYFLSGGTLFAMDFTKSAISDIEISSCEDDEDVVDNDNDNICDKYDDCLGGNNEEDADGDKIPDACDKDKDDADIAKCKYVAKSEYNDYCCAEEIEYSITLTETVECKEPGLFG
ncbi:hypothetical protein HQ529_05575 [Candidatus Woesearchaeota archaeon]|nr:hypothetical protein [Candidatus Woesearchaeota archaeon]